MKVDELKKLIRDIPNFPKAGILFRDITPLIGNARGLAAIVDQMADSYLGKVDAVLGIESRGFIFGAPVAYRLGVGLAIARKPGKLPYRTYSLKYELEYGHAELQMHADGIAGGARVLLVDDVLATGGTMEAALKLVTRVGAGIVGTAFLIDLAFLNGAKRLGQPVFAVVTYT